MTFVNDFRGLGPSPNVHWKWMIHEGIYYFGYATLRDIEPNEELLVNYGASWGGYYDKLVDDFRGPDEELL
jgi:hypothetical protein